MLEIYRVRTLQLHILEEKKKVLRKQIIVVDVKTLTLLSDKLTLLLDLLQYVSTGNSITLQPTFKDFLFDSQEKGSSTSPWSQTSNNMKHQHA